LCADAPTVAKEEAVVVDAPKEEAVVVDAPKEQDVVEDEFKSLLGEFDRMTEGKAYRFIKAVLFAYFLKQWQFMVDGDRVAGFDNCMRMTFELEAETPEDELPFADGLMWQHSVEVRKCNDIWHTIWDDTLFPEDDE
jgi:hypothetical protein